MRTRRGEARRSRASAEGCGSHRQRRRHLVVGSQAILGSLAEEELPRAAWMSDEADPAFRNEVVGEEKADLVDGAIGELSQFHETYGYYAQGVDLTTAKLPN